jgi:hypothetical protein
MCPPSSEPIRPVGPVAGGVYVGRTELPGRVSRRERREGDPEERGRGHHHGTDDDHEPGHGQTWTGPDDRDPFAGTYDDHGRAGAHEQAARIPRTHVDYSA